MARLFDRQDFIEQVRANKTKRSNDGVLNNIHFRRLGKLLLNKKPRAVIFGERIKLIIPYYSYLPIHLRDCFNAYKHVQNMARLVQMNHQGTFDKTLGDIMSATSDYIMKIAENEEIKQFIFDFYEEDVHDEDVDQDFIWEFPYDIMASHRLDIIEHLDHLIDQIGWINVLNHTAADDIRFENKFI